MSVSRGRVTSSATTVVRRDRPKSSTLAPVLGPEHDVRALEVAVDDTATVRVDECRRDLCADCDHVVGRERPRGHPIRQRLTLDVLHHDVRVRPRLSNLVDRADTWMVQRGGGARLAEQLAGAARIAGRAHELERHGSIEARVAGEVDNPHSAAANLPDDVVMADRAADHCLAHHTDLRVTPGGRSRFSARRLFVCGPIARDAAARRSRRKVGHSMWLGAGQTAACRRLLRIALSRRIVSSSSSALSASIRRSMRGRPSGPNIRAISSSVKRGPRPSAISASRSSTPGSNRRRGPACQSRRSALFPHRSAVSRQERPSAAPPP